MLRILQARFTPSILTIGLFSLLLTACGQKQPVELNEQQYFNKAVRALELNNYQLAITQLEQLERRYPFGHYAKQAQIELVFAYFKFGDYAAARQAAERFIELHPDHPNTDYAYYMLALSTYPGVSRGVWGGGKAVVAKRDVESARLAFFEMRKFLQAFPDSPYAADGRQRLIYLRNLIAANEIHVANFYLRRRAFIAALRRANNVLKEFGNTPSVSDALAISVASYKRLGLEDEARAALQTLVANYPTHPAINAEGKFVDVSEQKKSFLHKITLGFFDKNLGTSPPMLISETHGMTPLPPPPRSDN